MIGKEFISYPGTHNKVLRKHNDKYYLIQKSQIFTGDIRDDILMTEEEINNFLLDQEIKKEKEIVLALYYKQVKEKEQEEAAMYARVKQQYNETHGYTDNMTKLQKGRVLAVLNTKEWYNLNGKAESMTRKDFIKYMVDHGYNLEHKKDVRNCGKKGVTVKENEYRAYMPDNSFFIITKTEYDYGMYLHNLTNKLIV